MMMPMLTPETFTDALESYLRASGMTAKAFGLAAVGDPNFVGDVRRGRSVGIKLVAKVHDFMASNPPSGEAA